MTAFVHTRDAVDDSMHATRRHMKRIARRGKHAANDIGDELRTLIDELQACLADGTHADIATLRGQIRERVNTAREKLDATRDIARERARAAFNQTDEFVHEKPWQTIAAFAGVALLVGAVLGRKTTH
ncbi:DUF883 family protein [Pararobbsia silviterrae]|uniref:DUF883 domain-containing protein n=1 Tax=Pararobbsia silviterrae TaxID=1792498 RepID=A0A494XB68_9BURK|nr:DUF883 family protein [Pararobbsia silviterrae]RKP45716.1 DUF883 domain-containing protein [Pararobbsia silviterrae]